MTTERKLSIGQLAKLADTTVRTIRYYIAEGLLPSSVDRGSTSYYNDKHLERLELIAILKERRMSLAEINHFIESMSAEELKKILDTAREIGMSASFPVQVNEQVATDAGKTWNELSLSTSYYRTRFPRVKGAARLGEDEILDQLSRSTPPEKGEAVGDDHWIRKELIEGVELQYKADVGEEMKIAIDRIVASGRSALSEQRNREKFPGSRRQSRFFHRKKKQGEK